MHGIAPPSLVPALLPSYLSFPQIGELPQVVHRVQAPDLAEPGTDALHDVLACLETAAPVGFPFEEVAGAEGVGAELEDTAKVARGRRRPEREFLHQVSAPGVEEWGDRVLEFGVGRGLGEAGVGLVVAGVYCELVGCLGRVGGGGLSREEFSPAD